MSQKPVVIPPKTTPKVVQVDAEASEVTARQNDLEQAEVTDQPVTDTVHKEPLNAAEKAVIADQIGDKNALDELKNQAEGYGEVPQAPLPKGSGSAVKVVMLQTCDPSPTIGEHNAVQDLGIERLEASKQYKLPADYANVLVDKKLAQIVQ